MSRDDERSLPISLVSHTVFCPRRTWLEAAGERVDSHAIEHGVAAHEHVDSWKGDRSARRRAVEVSSEVLGVHGRCDVVSVGDTGQLTVTEFKSSPVRRSSVVTAAQRLQLTLQGMCLREAGHEVIGHAVYFTTTKHMVSVEVTAEDEAWAREVVRHTAEIVEGATAPEPLSDDPRCDRCSHAGVCLPEERAERRIGRQIRVADPDGQVLHLATPGSRASMRRGRVVIVKGDDTLGDVPLDRVRGLVVHGNVDVSTGLLRELLWRSVTVVWCSGRGSIVGFARSAHSPNGSGRQQQRARSAEGDLGLAREFIAAKVANQP